MKKKEKNLEERIHKHKNIKCFNFILKIFEAPENSKR